MKNQKFFFSIFSEILGPLFPHPLSTSKLPFASQILSFGGFACTASPLQPVPNLCLQNLSSAPCGSFDSHETISGFRLNRIYSIGI
ncbi:unnamed protein product [Lactuca virosa]|uniref:Uncharacterized protein n=1 Tax=Lactuca virosa TaxID=75947 RepID=A0AAU9MEQ1_9ASTR|nr:unnamed protein product [Lactuca virosa]